MQSKWYPKTRFREFKDEYIKLRFGDVFTIFNGYAFKSKDATNKGVRWLKIADVGIQEMTPKSPSYLPAEYGNKYDKFSLSNGDYVVALTRPILKHKLKISRINNEYHGSLLNQRVGKIVSEQKIDFIYYLLQCRHIIFDIENRIDGSDPPNLSPREVESIKCSVPFSLNEQQKIANFLSVVDKKISLLKEKYALLEQYKKGVMQKLFSQEIRFKDENGNEFSDWEMFKLNEIVTPIKRRLEKAIETVLTISAKKGFLLQADRFSQIIAGNSLVKYTHLKKNEFSYNRGNSKTYTYGCIYKLDDYDEALVPNIYRSFSLNKGCTEFFSQLFRNKYLDSQLRRLISSSARMDGLLNIGEKDFYEVKVPFPCEKEQVKISTFLKTMDKKLEHVAIQIELTETFKKGLLQQMFV